MGLKEKMYLSLKKIKIDARLLKTLKNIYFLHECNDFWVETKSIQSHSIYVLLSLKIKILYYYIIYIIP